MFIRATMPTFSRTVTVHIPSADGVDKFEVESFVAKFIAKTNTEIDELDRKVTAMTPAESAANPFYVLRQVTVGWDGVLDADKNQLPFTSDNLATVLNLPWVGPAMMRAWREGVNGQAARLGN